MTTTTTSLWVLTVFRNSKLGAIGKKFSREQNLLFFTDQVLKIISPEDIAYDYVSDTDFDVSSTKLREEIRKEIYDDFDEMMDDLSFCKGYEDELENYKY